MALPVLGHPGRPGLGHPAPAGLEDRGVPSLVALGRGHEPQALVQANVVVVGDEPPDHRVDRVTVRDMGEHGLKDLTRREHVYQLNVAGLPEDFPPLASLNAIPNNLPIQLTELVGRRVELAEAEQLLKRTRLLTILGPGGAGKTRLAIQTAADITAGFPDGVCRGTLDRPA
jgi:hypothetical protein